MKPDWKRLWNSVTRFQADKVNPWVALRNTVGLTAPLAVSVALGEVSAGLAMGTGALNVSFRDSAAPYAQRARLLFAASVVAGLAVFAGGLTGRGYVSAVLVAAVWAFAAGMLYSLSAAAADLGVLSLVLLLIYSASQQAAEHAVLAGLLAFGGGLGQTALSILSWPIRPYGPERRALADLYSALARAAASPADSASSPAATAESTAAQNALAALNRDDSLQGERYRSLLSQAERMRLSILALARARIRTQRENVERENMQRENPGSSGAAFLDRCLELSSPVLLAISDALIAGKPLDDASRNVRELELLTEQVRESRPELQLRDALAQMDALAGQIRAAVDLAANTTPEGSAAFERREAAAPPRLRLAGRLATLRANLNWESAIFRHALRLAVCVAVGDALARGFDLRRSYWLPMTIAIVLRPDFTATFTRGVARLSGTFAGLVFATALFHVLPPSRSAQVAAIAVLMFLVRCFGPANYGIFVTAITGLVVLLLAMTGVDPKEAIAARAVNTAAGGAIALLAYWLWPTWEHTQFPEAMAKMLETFRLYFKTVEECYVHGTPPDNREIDRRRLAGRLARTNLEACVERSRAEPGASAEYVGLLGGIVASSHRLAHAMLALEAGLYGRQPTPPPEAFRQFAGDVEVTLSRLAAALRGSPLTKDSFPDLRQDHHRLIRSADPVNHALLNVETDRITNSLNTLSEQILQWIHARE